MLIQRFRAAVVSERWTVSVHARLEYSTVGKLIKYHIHQQRWLLCDSRIKLRQHTRTAVADREDHRYAANIFHTAGNECCVRVWEFS